MDFFETSFIAIALAMDCFAVSLGVGTSRIPLSRRLIFRITYHFGLFQGGMAFLGWLAGKSIVDLIANFDHWVAFILLAFVGGRMILDGWKKEDEPAYRKDPSRGKSLIMLSIATSIDALAVGLSFAFLKVNIWQSSFMIGITSTLLSLVGLLIGHKLSQRFGNRMEIAGGVILNFIGIRILFTHIF
ncbi:MAG: manganese efflux pump MntP family protein [Anaerolineaceae bacterium]|nr:manganese efflux pump MntP family protein [Anaerolineaceae bacterium]